MASTPERLLQSVGRTARRSEQFSNWRTKAASPSDNIQQRGIRRRSDNLGSPAFDTRNINALRTEDDPRVMRAIEERRRLYVGNMPYLAKTEDVETLFLENGYRIEHIDMSIDPFTGRNPSYCFVEVTTKAEADEAIEQMNGKELLGRLIKIGPGVARSKAKRSLGEFNKSDSSEQWSQPIFQRWTRTDAADHWKGYSQEGRRLFVGGLPVMRDHYTVNRDVRELFKGFNIEAVSKVVIPAQPAFGDEYAWNHRYLFVDFGSAEEAAQAFKVTNGKQMWGVKIRVAIARSPDSRKTGERDAWDAKQGSS